MKGIEKFLIWFVPLFCLEYLIQGTASTYVLEALSDRIEGDAENLFPGIFSYFYLAIKPFLSFATKLLVSVWLYFEAKSYATKPLHWAFFGAVSGVLAIAIFYLVLIFDEHIVRRNDKKIGS